MTLPFMPFTPATVKVPADTTSANVQLGANGTLGYTAREGALRVLNSGSSNARIAFGTSNAVTATTPASGSKATNTYTSATVGSLTVLAGSVEVFTIPPGTTHVAFICDAGSTTLEFTVGAGL